MTEKPADNEGLWVRVDVLPTGIYAPVVTYLGDHSWSLVGTAKDYAMKVAWVATCAEHDAAVARLLQERLDASLEGIAAVMVDIREGRGSAEVEVLPGMRLQPGVNSSWKPFVTIHVNGEESYQVDTPALLEHAAEVLKVAAAAGFDAHLRKVLVHNVGLDDMRARAVVASLAEYWPSRNTA